MDAGTICGTPHQPAQSIDFAHDLPFGLPADGRIAAHTPHCGWIQSEQHSFDTQQRCSAGRLGPSMASANDNNALHTVHGAHHTSAPRNSSDATTAAVVQDLFAHIAQLRARGAVAALATVVGARGSTPAKPPARMVVHRDGTLFGTVGGGCVEADVIRCAFDAMDTGRLQRASFRLSGEEAERSGIACGGSLDIMIESLEDPRVVLVGAGHVAQAVCPLAAKAGFNVWVADDRPDFACRERFPEAQRLVVGALDALEAQLALTPRTALLVMTRGHSEDFSVLQWALGSPCQYIGVLGSRKKRADFESALITDPARATRFNSVQMPVGVDIGAESVDEIAISIVAGLIQMRRTAARHA